MCGILFRLSSDSPPPPPLPPPTHTSAWNSLLRNIQRRGPDATNFLSREITHNLRTLHATFVASVLHLRGPGNLPTPQPAVNRRGDVLCWNGEVFDGLEIPPDENDTLHVLRQLEESVSDNTLDSTGRPLGVLNVLNRVRGPYAFVYYEESARTLWFGRDSLGRRSLLWQKTKENGLILSSVGYSVQGDCAIENCGQAPPAPFEEVPARGIYRLDLDILTKGNATLDDALECFEWRYRGEGDAGNSCLTLLYGPINPTIPSPEELLPCPEENDTSLPEPTTEILNAVRKLTSVLGDAVRQRVIGIPIPPLPKMYDSSKPPSRLGLLFSGGLDCAVLAALAHQYAPEDEAIDLLNVSFENPRKAIAKSTSKGGKKTKNKSEKGKGIVPEDAKKQQETDYDGPDRITGRSTVAELRKVYPTRIWNFVEVDVSYTEACAHKEEIAALMAPSDTIMDMSIAMAFYFASRGIGHLSDPPNRTRYETPARVLLLGLGADEQLGGYSRHRSAYLRDSYPGLIRELQLDVDRISTRNLGRDDRIVSSHGKEGRYPYLDARVMNVLAGFPVHWKCDPRFDRGLGDKLVLRLAAKELGLEKVSREKKRAVQFGARTAKMENSNERGHQSLQ